MTHTPAPISRLDLYRIGHYDDGTTGFIHTHGHTFSSLEPPWRHNARGISCIPPGTYLCELGTAPSFPNHYCLAGVPDRAGIVIHSGNYAGDTSRGFKSDTEGCILLGRACVMPGPIGGTQRAVSLSRSTVAAFNAYMRGKPFWLTIHPPLADGERVPPPSKPQRAAA